jgi:L-rhamnose mutarotase
VKTLLDFNWNAAIILLTTLNRQNEWEDFMAKFQLTTPGATATEK